MPKSTKKHHHKHHHKDDTPSSSSLVNTIDTLMLQVNDSSNKLVYLKGKTEILTAPSTYFSIDSDSSMLLTVFANETPIVPKGGPRTEFRELNSDLSNASWDSTNGGTLTVELSIESLPLDNKTTCFAQIKTPSKECQLVCADQTIYLRQFDVTHQILKTNYILGTKFKFTLIYKNDLVSLVLDTGESAHFTAKESGCYFKFGNYMQSNLTTKVLKNSSCSLKIYNFIINH